MSGIHLNKAKLLSSWAVSYASVSRPATRTDTLLSRSTRDRNAFVNQKLTFTFRLHFGVVPLCTAAHFLFCGSVNELQIQQVAPSLQCYQWEKAKGRPSSSALSSTIQASRHRRFWCVMCLTQYFVWLPLSEHKGIVHTYGSKSKPSISDNRLSSVTQCSVRHLPRVTTLLRRVVHLSLTL